MTIDAVRGRRHAALLNRIADERIRKGRRRPGVARVKSTRLIVSRDSDDTAGGQPATIVRIGVFPALDPGDYHTSPGVSIDGDYEVLEKIVWKSGPVIVGKSFGPADVGPDGDIVIQDITVAPQIEPPEQEPIP